MKTKLIFCANEQAEIEHTLEVDNNGEIVATCACGRFIKFPATTTATEVELMISEHKQANVLSEEQARIEEARKASEVTVDLLADKTPE